MAVEQYTEEKTHSAVFFRREMWDKCRNWKNFSKRRGVNPRSTA
jgi:hypothetical protein